MSDNERILARVLGGLAADRVPGFSFTGHFLDTTWPHIGRDHAQVAIPAGPHCTDAAGRTELTALLMTFDASLSTATRLFIEPGERLATAHFHAQFTGAPLQGGLTFDCLFEGRTSGDAVGQLMARGTTSAAGATACHGSATFVRLPAPPGTRTMAPLPWQDRKRALPPPLALAQLDERERQIHAIATAALAPVPASDASFLRRFWGILPQAVPEGAVCRVAGGPHMANRVGHVQGGILMGLAAETAIAAVPRHPVFSNLSAWFISPGRGAFLECRSTVIHSGRSFAVVKSEILGEGGVRVLEAVTAHASAA
jgi:acyl-coenzyme A thioesterase PaaI-like protein